MSNKYCVVVCLSSSWEPYIAGFPGFSIFDWLFGILFIYYIQNIVTFTGIRRFLNLVRYSR